MQQKLSAVKVAEHTSFCAKSVSRKQPRRTTRAKAVAAIKKEEEEGGREQLRQGLQQLNKRELKVELVPWHLT